MTEEELKKLSARTGITDANIDSIRCANCDPLIRILSGGRAGADGSYDSPTKFSNPNNNSLVVRVDFGRASFLITGDLEKAGIENMVARYTGTTMLDTDVYLAGHHGSHNATTKTLLNAVTPKMAVTPVGHWTDGSRFQGDIYNTFTYGHPRSSVVKMLAESVSETRSPAANVKTAAGQFDFEAYKVTKAIYATGWDGDVAVSAKLDGSITVQATGDKHTQTHDSTSAQSGSVAVSPTR